MNSEEPQKLYHFYGGCNSPGYFFIQKGNPENFFSFGYGYHGELANGESYNETNTMNFPTPKIAKNVPKMGKVSKIAKGYNHTLFLMSPREDVYGVGRSDYGALSVNEEEVLSPVLIISEALKGVRIGDIACGSYYSVFLSKNGVPYSCGYNEYGQCGSGTNSHIYSAVPMKFVEEVIQIDCGYYYAALCTNKRDIFITGQIGDEVVQLKIPKKLNLNEKVKFFQAGGHHLLVVGKSKQMYGIGDNFYNQISTSISSFSGEVSVLTKITSLPDGEIKDIKCSIYDSYVLMENNDLYGWGLNNYGQSKGNGTVSTSPPYNPTPFKMKNNVKQIEVGKYSCFVFCKEGVYVCGYNEDGGLEMGNTNKIPKLTLNKNLKNIKRIVPKVIIPIFDLKNQIFDVIIKTH